VTIVQWDLNVTVPKAFYVNTVLDFSPLEVSVKRLLHRENSLKDFIKIQCMKVRN